MTKQITTQAARGDEAIAGYVMQWTTYGGKVKQHWMPDASEAWVRYSCKQVSVLDWCRKYTEVNGKRIVLV